MRAGHVAACMCVVARRHIHDTSRRTRLIPVVDRSNNSSFYTIAFGDVGVFIILSVLGLQIQIGSNRSFARRYANTCCRRSHCMKKV